MFAMRKVGIKALKNGLSGYIRAAAAGETVLVTDRDRVVAELSPPRARAEGTEEERGWAELIREGMVTPAKRPLGGPPESLNIMTFEELMAQIAADREDR
ncbi:MAG: prevent-host-death protein [Roseiarcus sp.]